jgi:hypothetical protein
LNQDSAWPFFISLETANIAVLGSNEPANPQFSATGKCTELRLFPDHRDGAAGGAKEWSAKRKRDWGKMTKDQVSSGEFADLRPTPKVYLASNIVSAIAKDDTPTESEALNRLLQAWDDKKVDLVTSEVTLSTLTRTN